MAFLVPLLVGVEAVAATATAAAVPATVGLFGAAGGVTAGGLLTAATLAGGAVTGVQAFGQAQAQAESAKLQQEVAAGQFTENRLRRLRAARRQLAQQRARGGVSGDISGAIQGQFLGETGEALAIERGRERFGRGVSRAQSRSALAAGRVGFGLGLAQGGIGGADRFLRRRRFGV